ncbi:MAG: hypothetical protein JWO32_67 [Bacteroidetes bacterium]|nr:hypothetical protein [Bacteroidota bacterium]
MYPHIFTDHLLKKHHALPQVNPGHELIWPSVFLLSCFALLVIIKVTSFGKVAKLMQACFNIQLWRQLEREEFNPFKFYSILLSVFFFMNLTFFAYKVNTVFNWVLIGHSRLEQFLFLFLFILILFSLKGAFNKILSVIVDDNKLIPEFVYSSFVISQTFGVFLFPCLVLAELSNLNTNLILLVSCVILTASQLFKWYRGILFGLIEHRIGLLQIFVYFCALEILPALVMVKFVIETF